MFLIGKKSYPLSKTKETLIGRDPDILPDGIFLSFDRCISRIHASISYQNNKWILTDKGSLCGTFTLLTKIGENTDGYLDFDSAPEEHKKANAGEIELQKGDIITFSKPVRNLKYSFLFTDDISDSFPNDLENLNPLNLDYIDYQFYDDLDAIFFGDVQDNFSNEDTLLIAKELTWVSTYNIDEDCGKKILEISKQILNKNDIQIILNFFKQLYKTAIYSAPEALIYNLADFERNLAIENPEMTRLAKKFFQNICMSALDLIDQGKKIRGILMDEDIFYENIKYIPEFAGVINISTPSNRYTLYVKPITEEDKIRANLKSGEFGVIFTGFEIDELPQEGIH